MLLNEIISASKTGQKNLSTEIFMGATGVNLRFLNKNWKDIRPLRKVGKWSHGIIPSASWHRVYVAYDEDALHQSAQQEPNPELWMEKDLYKWIGGFLNMTSTRSGWKAFEVDLSSRGRQLHRRELYERQGDQI